MKNYELMEVLKDYLETNAEEMLEVIKEINSYDSSLDWLDFIDMDCFDEYMAGQSPSWIAERIYYGDFNPNHAYFIFNGYGNLESHSMYDVIEECTSYINEIVDRVIELHPWLNLNDNIESIFIEYELTDDEEE